MKAAFDLRCTGKKILYWKALTHVVRADRFASASQNANRLGVCGIHRYKLGQSRLVIQGILTFKQGQSRDCIDMVRPGTDRGQSRCKQGQSR